MRNVWLILAIIAVVSLVILAIVEATKGRDVKTGVANDKIKKAAESVGVPTKLAEIIANAPDSKAAAESVGILPVVATSLANGVAPVVPNSQRTSDCKTTCEKTDPFNGSVIVWNQACTPTQASNGFATIVRCGGNTEASGTIAGMPKEILTNSAIMNLVMSRKSAE